MPRAKRAYAAITLHEVERALPDWQIFTPPVVSALLRGVLRLCGEPYANVNHSYVLLSVLHVALCTDYAH